MKKKKWKHQNCTLESRLVGEPPYIENQTWCKNHNERIVSTPK